jgi:AMMECR1 domain-containing protein
MMTSTHDAQKTAENQARKALEAAKHEERFRAMKRAEEEQIEAKTMQLRALRLARDGRAPEQCG